MPTFFFDQKYNKLINSLPIVNFIKKYE